MGIKDRHMKLILITLVLVAIAVFIALLIGTELIEKESGISGLIVLLIIIAYRFKLDWRG